MIQLASKNKEIYDFVNIHYVENEDAEDELFEETIAKIRDEISFLTHVANGWRRYLPGTAHQKEDTPPN